MLTIACAACQKKLSVKEDTVGKKVKCPGCGELTVVTSHVGAPVGLEEMRTLPPAPGPAAPIPSAPQGDANSPPTNPSLSKPDATQGLKPDSEHDSSLTDFLAPPQADDELGRLGDFRVLKILGHGGMGVVFLGEDSKLRRKVAIKAMLPHLAQSKSSQQRFLREARSAATLEHDHIVAIHHVGEDRGAPYIVMPFLKGEPLDERLKRDEPISISEMLRIGREVAEALNAAHTVGLVHRDIKPANIWLEAPKNRVKILDFGLARATAEESGITQQGAIIGTPAYMAPEQGRGDPVDARCDLFSLGVVMYRLCTGKQPFHGRDTVSTLMSVATHDPDPPAKINMEVPIELSDLVMKLLEKDPAKRIGSAKEVIEAVQAIEEMIRNKESREPTIAVAVPVRSKPSLDKVLFAVDDSLASSKELTQPSAQTSAASVQDAPAKRRSKAPLAIAAALISIALVAAGIIFYWQTNNGIVRIEINDPDIKVAFDKNGPTITGVDKHDIKLTPGEFGLTVERGDLKFDTDKFILKRGEIITLKIEWFPAGKLQVVRGDKVILAKMLPKANVVVGAPGTYALAFEPTTPNGVRIPSLHFGLGGPITLEGYFSQTSAAVGSSAPITLNGRAWILGASLPAKKWGFNVNGTKGGYAVAATEKVTLNEKAHVAGVFDGKTVRLFVNGKLTAQREIKDENPVSKLPSELILATQFGGLIHEVRISKAARYDKDFTPQARFEPDKDTLALYHFDEGFGDVLKDSSGNRHHGKIVGAKWVKADGSPIPSSQPSVNYRLVFQPASEWSVAIPSVNLKPKGDVTLEGYFSFESGAGVFLADPHRLGLNAKKVGDKFFWAFSLVDGNANTQEVQGPEITPRQCTHVAGVWANKQLRLYVNGKNVGTKKLGDLPLGPGKGLPFGVGKFIAGWCDEARVSKTARYDTDFTPAQRFEPDKDTLALYHFDEGTGDVLKDSSGNGHHGKIVGAKWVRADGAAIGSFPPLDPVWLDKVAKLPAKEQIEAVKAELMKRNPGFDGKVTPVIDKAGVATELEFLTVDVSDISPVCALSGLQTLKCNAIQGTPGSGKLTDLSPLKDLKLTALHVRDTSVSDLSPLRDMKLTFLDCAGTKVSDLSLLKDMPLATFDCILTPISDLSPLKNMPLRKLSFTATRVSDLSPLRAIKTLETINYKSTAEFWKEVDKK